MGSFLRYLKYLVEEGSAKKRNKPIKFPGCQHKYARQQKNTKGRRKIWIKRWQIEYNIVYRFSVSADLPGKLKVKSRHGGHQTRDSGLDFGCMTRVGIYLQHRLQEYTKTSFSCTEEAESTSSLNSTRRWTASSIVLWDHDSRKLYYLSSRGWLWNCHGEEATTSEYLVDLFSILPIWVMSVETRRKLTEQPDDHISPLNRHSGW